MNRYLTGLIALALSLGFLSSSAFAVDYDFEQAKRDWERAEDRLATADRELAAEQRALVPLIQAYDRASDRVDSLTRQLQDNYAAQARVEDEMDRVRRQRDKLVDDLRDLRRRADWLVEEIDRLKGEKDDIVEQLRRQNRRLEQINRRIRELEGQPNEGAWTCVFRDRGHEEHRGGHPFTHRNKDRAQEKAEEACLELHGECRLVGCTQPENDELKRLKEQRTQVQNRIRNNENKKRDLENKIANFRRELQRNRNDQDNLQRRIDTLNRKLESLADDFQRLEREEQRLNIALADARDDLADARSARDRQQRIVDQAQGRRDEAFRSERAAYAYYQEVLDNYNRAYAAAQSKGRQDATGDANREAAARAEAPAQSAGQTAGTQAGRRVGLEDAKIVAGVRGYNFGLSQGASAGNLRAAFNEGKGIGEQIASRKAQAEDFPRGYNDRMNEVLANPPSNLAEYDITDSLPDIPAGDGRLLDPKSKSIGSVRPPSHVAKNEPSNRPPRAGRVSPQVPSPDNRFFDPECGNQPLPVFSQACRDTYTSTYASAFRSKYTENYRRVYSARFATASDSAYASARDTEFPAEYNAQALEGAKDLGELRGFAAAIDGARTAAYAAGQQAFNTYRDTGYLTLLREVVVEQAVDDNNLSPGETVKIKVRIDNYGGTATPGQDLQLHLDDLVGGLFQMTVRDLPTLAADTTTVLTGVLTGRAAEAAVSALQFNAKLEFAPDGAEPTVLDEASFETGIRLPVVMTDVQFAGPLTIGQAGEAILAVKNQTTESTDPIDMTVAVRGEGLTLDVDTVLIPALDPGETASIPVSITADASAGGSEAVSFELTGGPIAGSGELTLSKAVQVPVARNGELRLCMPRCGSLVSLPLRVRAGSTLNLRSQFVFTGTRRATFEFGKLDTSNSSITGTGTVRVGPGQWGPGSSPYDATFSYRIPTSLRGQTHWVRLYVKEGRNTIHIVKVPFVVQ